MIGVPGLWGGVFGLRYEHFLSDSMHYLELGVLLRFHATVLWFLILAGRFGEFVKTSADNVNAAMTASLTECVRICCASDWGM